MKLKNRIKYAGMAAALALSLTTPTFAAAGVTNKDPGPYDHTQSAKGGDTIVSIYETKIHTGNLSVEVPLYLTMAVVKADTDPHPTLVPPTNYYIKNTSTEADGTTAASYPIGITGVHIDSVNGGSWILQGYKKTRDDGTGQQIDDPQRGAGTGNATSKIMTLSFSGKLWDKTANGWGATTAQFDFPALGLGQSNSVSTFLYDMDGSGGDADNADANLFATPTGNPADDPVYNPIPAGKKLDIVIDGGVASAYEPTQQGQPAVPQFRVTYTVSALDPATNKPIGAPYAGKIYGPYPDHGLLDNPGTSNFTNSNPNPKNP